MTEPLVVLDHVTVARPGGPGVLDNLSWTIHDGQTWAVVGPTGSGKTTLAEVLLGKLPMRSGSIAWPLVARVGASYPSDVIRHVGFAENSRLFSYAGHYYQQRFEFADADEPLTLGQFLRAGTTATDAEVRSAAARLGVADRLDTSFIKLSNGQARRARIARALLLRPELLILDDPFLGVDAAGRAEVADLLGGLVKQGLRLVLICDPEAVPGWATDVLELGAKRPLPPAPSPTKGGGGNQPPSSSPSPPGGGGRGEGSPPPPVVELHSVTVAHGGTAILSDVTWTVRAGERWAVVGPNGSGKTTLLSLLCGDHPQAYSNDIRLFGRRRGTGESIWDVKRPVGLVSPEFHLYFPPGLTAGRAAATGFFDGIADQPTTPGQDAAVRELFAAFGIADLAGRPFRPLSTGEQRLVLLARGLVKRPPLVILDEPFQALDRATAGRCRDWLDRNLSADQTLLFVSHHDEEIPATVSRRLRLAGGRVVETV